MLLAPSPTHNLADQTSSGRYPLTCLACVALPGAYNPASITLRVIGGRKPPFHDKAVVLEDEINHKDQLSLASHTFIARMVKGNNAKCNVHSALKSTSYSRHVQSDSKLLSGFPWSTIFEWKATK
jgi:hypothetical protein